MSKRTVKVTVEPTWLPGYTLRLYRGTENAGNLAASTPSGGVVVTTQKIGNAVAGSQITLSFQHRAKDIVGLLPVGVTCVDEAGNESPVLETIIQLADPPEPPGRPDVAGTGNPGEVTLTWAASPDLQ